MMKWIKFHIALLPNAFTSRTQMRVLQSGEINAGLWINERRNVLVDAQQVFGKHQYKTNLIAVASETDNTGEKAHAGFADLHFVAAHASCNFPSEKS